MRLHETLHSAPGRSDAAGSSAGAQAWSAHDAEFGDRYQAPRFIGSGGMGHVVRVYDTLLERDVALKSLSSSATPTARERFSREATTTAGLGHRGIVTVYDKGACDGVPYYTMELLTGGCWDPLDSTPLRTQLSRLASVCESVGFANERRVIHRDLKPSNLLLSEFGDMVVVDWGIAKIEHPPPTNGTTVAAPAAPMKPVGGVGTPLYMSPEQARGEEADARSDVWSLGMMLLELLSKEHPFAGLRASTIVERLGADDGPDVRGRLAATAPELVAIVESALAVRRTDRYRSAAVLGDDLRRYLDGRRIRVFAYSKQDALRRVYKAFGPVINVAAAATIGMVFVVGWAWRRTADERDRALQAERAALDLEQRARGAERAATAQRSAADAFSTSLLAEQARGALERGDSSNAEQLARSALSRGPSADAHGVLMQTWAATRPEQLQDYERPCPDATLSSGALYILCTRDGSLFAFETRTGKELFTVTDLAPSGTAIIDDGAATLTWSAGGTATSYDLTPVLGLGDKPAVLSVRNLPPKPATTATPREPGTRTMPLSPCESGLHTGVLDHNFHEVVVCASGDVRLDGRSVSESPLDINGLVGLDADTVAFSQGSGEFSTLGLSTGVWKSWPTQADRVAGVSVVGSGFVALTTEVGDTMIWDVDLGVERVRLPQLWGQQHRVRDDGAFVSIGSRVRVWRFPDDAQAAHFDARKGVSEAHYVPESQSLAAALADGSVILWDAKLGSVRWQRHWQDASVIKAVSLVPGSEYVVGMAALDSRIHVFAASDGSRVNTLENGEGGRRLLALRDGSIWATSYGGGIRRWEQALSNEAGTMLGFGGVEDASASEDRSRAIILEEHSGVLARVGEGRTEIERLGHVEGAVAVDLSNDGRRIVVAHAREAYVLDDQLVRRTPVFETRSDIVDVSISGSGDRVAIGSRDGTVLLWSTATGERLASIDAHTLRVSQVDFVQDALISASWDGTVRRYDLAALSSFTGLTAPSRTGRARPPATSVR